MDFADLIVSSRSYLDRFNYDEYPICFAEFSAAADPLFEALSEADINSGADRLIDELDRRHNALPARRKKAAADQDKQVLALFLTPAAIRRGNNAAEYARVLCERWNLRHPQNRYYLGDYETILKGFDANLLGLPLRKSRKRR